MRYFVTGATGFIGGHLVRQLREAGHDVVALVRSPEKAGDLAALGVTLVQGDITEKDTLRGPMEGADGVFHLAAWYKVGAADKRPAVRINVDGTRNVLETMRALAIPRGVYTSTLAIFSDTGGRVVDETYRYDGSHLSEYDRTKWLAHYAVAEPMMKAGLPLIIVQPGLVYGPDDPSTIGDLFRDYQRRRLPMLPKETAFCWTHVEDTARAHILAMEKGTPGETYIIGGPIHTLVEAFDLAEEITGIKAPPLRFRPALLKATAALAGLVDRVATIPPPYDPESLRVSAGTTYLGDDAKARRTLGFAPRPLHEGLRQTLR